MTLSDLKRVGTCTSFSILSDIDGSLANANICSRSFVTKTNVRLRTFHIRFFFLYYNFCLCKSFKELAP
jgi:hypothetical protein